jgi:HPt (histidine-containing phosphotransfer) domain-containing protein
MSTIVLAAIIGVDILLVFGMLVLLKNQRGTDLAISDLTAEREMIAGLQTSIRHDISKTSNEQKSMMTRLSKIAAEIEQEVSSQKSGIGDNLDQITSELAQEFEKPLRELTKKQNALANLYKKIKAERAEIERTAEKAAQLIKFFNEKVPYDEILCELEDKKYMDARRLLAKGVSAKEVSTRLGLPLAELEVMNHITSI